MIAKILTAYVTTLRYIVTKALAQLLEVFGLEGDRWQDWQAQMERHEMRHRGRRRSHLRDHYVLSPARGELLKPDGTVDREAHLALAKNFLGRMGQADCPHVIMLHLDTDTPHTHTVVSRYDRAGRYIPDSHHKYKARAEALALERELGLTITAEVGKGRAAKAREAPLAPAGDVQEIPPRQAVRSHVEGVLEQVLRGGRIDYGEFVRELDARGVEVRLNIARTGRISGISYGYEGMRFKGSEVVRALSWGSLVQLGLAGPWTHDRQTGECRALEERFDAVGRLAQRDEPEDEPLPIEQQPGGVTMADLVRDIEKDGPSHGR